MTSLDYLLTSARLVMMPVPACTPKRARPAPRVTKASIGGTHGAPGQEWQDVISQHASKKFSQAFVERPILEALVLRTPRVGIDAIRDYFKTSHKLFDQIAFVREARTPDRLFLEWEGRFGRMPISGVTVLSLANDGRIARIRIHHYPQEQATAFADMLEHQDQTS